MYSAVLMLALTAGSDSVDFGRNGCNGGGHGCSSGYGCSTSFVGGHGCSGCSSRGGLFGGGHHGNRGCNGGFACSSSYGCSSSCHGGGGLFRGGLFGGHGNRGHGCNGGGYGCNGGGYGCNGGGYACSGYGGVVINGGCTGACTGGGTIIVPSTTKPKDMPKGEPVKEPKKTSIDSPATIVVSLPADARLLVDGAQTTSTSDRRTLVTPTLQVGSTYIYNMTAEIVREGRTVTQTQQVAVRSGETSTINFSFPTSQTVATSN
jgi:uncharacterized protein (TIGR03000 family)